MPSKDHTKNIEKICLKSLKNINNLEDKINIELEKSKLLLLLLNCENLNNIQPLLKKIFEEIQMLEVIIAGSPPKIGPN